MNDSLVEDLYVKVPIKLKCVFSGYIYNRESLFTQVKV